MVNNLKNSNGAAPIAPSTITDHPQNHHKLIGDINAIATALLECLDLNDEDAINRWHQYIHEIIPVRDDLASFFKEIAENSPYPRDQSREINKEFIPECQKKIRNLLFQIHQNGIF